MTRLVVAVLEHPRHLAVAAFASGIACWGVPSGPFALISFALAGALVGFGARPAAALSVVACAIGGAAVGQARVATIDADPLAAVGRTGITLRGWALEHARNDEFGSKLRARVAIGDATQKVEIRSRERLPFVNIGDELLVTGRQTELAGGAVRSARTIEYGSYLRREGIRRRVDASSVVRTGARRGGALGVLDSIRGRSERAMAFGLGSQPAALLRGMVLGGNNGLSAANVEAFKVAGLAHVLAVSGANILLLVVLVGAIARAAGLGRRARIAVPALLILVYVPLCGGQASVVRAGAMGLAGLAAISASRPASRIYALLLASAVVLAWNPRATEDIGAQLSFAAVAGIMALAAPVAARLNRWPLWIAEAFATTFAATIATAPLMALHFGRVSLVSLAANVVAAPLIGPIVWIGSLTATIGQVSLPLAALLNAPNEFLLGSLLTLARLAAVVPGAQLAIDAFGTIELVASATAIAGFAAWMNRATTGCQTGDALRTGQLLTPARATPVAFCAAVAVVLAAGLTLFVRGHHDPPRRPAIVFLDIGQGDATLLLGAQGCNALIDGGPPGAGLPGKLRRLGVRRLDLVVATHPQQDHDGGLIELARAGEPRIGALLDGGGNTRAASFAELRARLRAERVPTAEGVAGTEWTCGDISIDVLGPRAQTPGAPPPVDPNTRAIVALVRVGSISMLASGDAESPQLLHLPLPRAGILKVPHHGSDDAGLPDLLRRIRPDTAVVEVGRDNRYGHPTDATISALEAAVPRVFRTDRDGQVTIGPGGTFATDGPGDR